MPFEKQLIRHENYSMRCFSRIHGIPSSMGKGEIDENILLKLLGENQLLESPEYYFKWHLIKKSDVKTAIMI
jgi:hypothetical protein